MSSWLPEDWLKIIVLIEKQSEDDKGKLIFIPIGTGFIIEYKTVNCLITCKHVIKEERICITSNLKLKGIIRKPIEKLAFSWHFHPNPDVDLAVIPVPLDPQTEDYKKLPLNLFEDFENINDGDDVFFLGFPLGIRSESKITPIVRAGIVALKKEDHAFLIDANVFPGNSGSPVFLRPSIIDFKTRTIGEIRPPMFIGVIKSYITYTDYAISPQTGRARVSFEENAGLAEVYSTKIVKELLESNEFQKTIEKLTLKNSEKENSQKTS